MFFFKLIFERIGAEFVYVCCYKMDEDNVKKRKKKKKMDEDDECGLFGVRWVRQKVVILEYR
jgi:hypothetical protein